MSFSGKFSLILARITDKRVFAWTTAIAAFFIPVLHKGIQLPIILLFIAWLITPKPAFRKNFIHILIFTLIYILHIVGMFYTENIDRGFADLEQKLSLLIFPILFGSVSVFNAREYRRILWAFCAGILISVCLAYSSSFINFQTSSDVNVFFKSQFSPVHHPSYVSMYINFAIFFILIELYLNIFPKVSRIALWIFILILIVSLLFSSSKAGYINFMMLTLVVIIFAFFERKLLSMTSVFFSSSVILFFVGLAWHPLTNAQISQTAGAVAGTSSADEIESSKARLIAWSIAYEEILKHPFGVGTGDINDTMVNRFKEDGYFSLADMNLNPHNNFLQIGLALGIHTLFVFVFSLMYGFKNAVRNRNWIYGFFLISIVLNFAVESMLEKQSGVIFYAFFNALLFFSSSNHDSP